jgi:hypothetical protein
MYEDKNVDILNDLISEYYTDVTESMYTPAKQEFDNRPQRSGKPASIVIGGSQYNAQTFNSSFVPYINRLAKLKEGDVETSPTGVKFTVKNGEYYRVSGMEKGKPVIDEDQGPMTLQGVGSYEGWGNYINFEDPLNPNK